MSTYRNMNVEPHSPANGGQEITPNDSVDLNEISRALYIGSDGNVSVETGDGTILIFKNVVGGSILPLQVRKVLATGTTSADIVAMW